MTLDPPTLTAIGGVLLAVLGSGSALAVWLRSRAAVAQARAETEPALLVAVQGMLQQSQGIAGDLRREVTGLRDRLDGCESKHRECEERAIRTAKLANDAHERCAQIEADRDARDREIAGLRRALAGRDADVTRRVQLAVERSITPTGTPRHTTSRDDEDTTPETPTARALGRMTAEIPAPRGAKEDR